MRAIATLLLLVLAATTVSAANASDGPPNVLFVVADDLNVAIAPYGDEVAITPNLNQLARRGVVFNRAYCQQAVCNPSRSSFLTGRRPNTVGVDDLRKSFRQTAPDGDALVTLPQYFKNHGYFCQNIGKLFHNMGATQDRESWSIDEVLHQGTHAADTVYANTPANGRRKLLEKAPVTEAAAVSDLAYRDGQIANFAASMIRNYPADDPPFFLAVGFWRPHLPFVAPKKYWDLYANASIPPPDPSGAPTRAPSIALHESREIHSYDGTPSDRDFTDQEITHLRRGYYASISFMDAQLGKILKALDTSGHANDTIVVFTSDHGFHIGQHGLWGKTTNFELDARVPLIVADPRDKASHGKSTDAFAELVDLYPTLAALAGIERDLSDRLEGDNLVPVLTDTSYSVKSAAFTRHQQPFYGPRTNWQAWGYSIRTNQWRYTEWRAINSEEVIASELYDHRSDPIESENVASVHPDVVAAHAKRLATHFGL